MHCAESGATKPSPWLRREEGTAGMPGLARDLQVSRAREETSTAIQTQKPP